MLDLNKDFLHFKVMHSLCELPLIPNTFLLINPGLRSRSAINVPTRTSRQQQIDLLSLAQHRNPSHAQGRHALLPLESIQCKLSHADSQGLPRKCTISCGEQSGTLNFVPDIKDQCVLQPFDQAGAGGPTGGSFGGDGGGGDDSEDGFSQPSGGKAYSLMLPLIFLTRSRDVAGLKFILPVLLSQCLFYTNVNAYADVITSQRTDTQEPAREDNIADSQEGLLDAVLELRGGKWTRLVIDSEKDEFVIDSANKNESEKVIGNVYNEQAERKSAKLWDLQLLLRVAEQSVKCCWNLTRKLMLPEGYPGCVSGDYLEYTLWRMGQGIASQINGVLTTQALLYAVGLGKGAIPTAAAVNWVLKDGIGYLSKILLAKYGRHFDVHPKGWRLLADLMENASYGLELLTPIFPQFFVYLGAVAGAGRSAAGLIQAATRSCFYAGFAAQRNFAEVIAKGEAQGMVSKSLGIMLGIAISSYTGSSGPLLVATFAAVSGAHMLCNLRSYQAVQLRTLNPYRASLVFCEYIKTGVVASVKEVNAEEPIFTEIPFLMLKIKGFKAPDRDDILSSQTKEDAAMLVNKLKLGVTFGEVITTQQEADVLFKIYHSEQYVLAERKRQYRVLLKVGATSHDLLRMMLQVCYLFQLQNQSSKFSEDNACNPVETSYKYMVDRFDNVQQGLFSAGWVTSDGLVSRPSPFRVLESHLHVL